MDEFDLADEETLVSLTRYLVAYLFTTLLHTIRKEILPYGACNYKIANDT